MDRREFIQQSMVGATALSVLSFRGGVPVRADVNAPGEPCQTDNQAGSALTTGDVHNYLRSLGAEWVQANNTVDTFKAGGPGFTVQGIAVGWMSYFGSLRKARELGCNLFITHEPTYYDHRDRDESVFSFAAARMKREFIGRSGLTIIRCHDVWDRVPEIGIRDAWARFLGLETEIEARITTDQSRGRPFCGVYEITPVEAGTLARRVAGKVATLGQDSVLFIGPERKLVSSVAVGTGAITPFRQMVEDLKADVVICTDDGFSFWRDGSLAIDMEYPVIIVNHPCSEEVGMRKLAEHLSEKFPQISVHHIAQTCMFRSVPSRRGLL
ncbi:MAG: hypothetical protein GTN78_00585 [Gemmatimonadales bacterium]|nr:hypothetical protein [Gemmatimonadales bacterium]NIN10035.1 hypothetical protein [Gemmatimonadales bacterium]NIQ98688.1 hypothetical protein [Gemmatimonadales bacterium]NIS63564.1 hypothetical protein [Gemmatimonadales bacterium]